MFLNRRLAMLALSALWLLPAGAAKAQTSAYQDPSWQKYQTLVQGSDLQTRPSEPYRLKLDYQLYDLDGNPTVKGTVERVWGQTDSPHTAIQSPTLQMTDAESTDKLLLHHTRESYLAHQILNAFVRPEPYSTRRLDFMLSRVRREINGVDLSCLSISLAGQELPRTQTFCMDADSQLAAITGDGPFQIDRTGFANYRDKKVPTDITISYRDKIAIKAHVTELTALTPSTAPATAEPVEAPIVPGQPISRPSAAFPMAAKLSHTSGLVILSVLITPDGHTTGVDVVSAPTLALARAAEDAVKKWTYTPYKRNGQPVEAEEAVTVDFSFVSN